jgi:hypothetical protein
MIPKMKGTLRNQINREGLSKQDTYKTVKGKNKKYKIKVFRRREIASQIGL